MQCRSFEVGQVVKDNIFIEAYGLLEYNVSFFLSFFPSFFLLNIFAMSTFRHIHYPVFFSK